MFATGAIRLLRISKFGIGAQELTVFVKATRFAVEHGGLTQGVPDLATLVLFTSFSMGVVWGRAVLGALFWEGSPNSGEVGVLSLFSRKSARQFNPVGVLLVALVLLGKDPLQPMCLFISEPSIDERGVLANREFLATTVTPKRPHLLEVRRLL